MRLNESGKMTDGQTGQDLDYTGHFITFDHLTENFTVYERSTQVAQREIEESPWISQDMEKLCRSISTSMIMTMEHLEEQCRKTAVGFGGNDRAVNQHIIEIEDVDDDDKQNDDQDEDEGEGDDDYSERPRT